MDWGRNEVTGQKIRVGGLINSIQGELIFKFKLPQDFDSVNFIDSVAVLVHFLH